MRRIASFLNRHLVISILVGLILLAVVFQIVTIWWYSFPPKRPNSVSPNAVFIWGLPVGLPAPKRGNWVNCWFDPKENVDECRVASVNGALLYQGPFLPYQGQTPVPENELAVDSKTTSQNGPEQVDFIATSEESSDPGVQVVPLLFLWNGNVLIPAKAYQAGKEQLDERAWESGHPPKRPGNVPASAVFIPWISSDSAGPVHGIWVNCWYDPKQNVDECRVATTEGKLYYQGPYLPYAGRTPVRESELSIDAKATYLHGAESAGFVSDFLAGRERSSAQLPQPLPFLYLGNGSVLLPVRNYQAEKGWLDELRAAHRP